MTVAAVLPAAGRGDRLGGGVPKALRLLGAHPLLTHAVRALESCPDLGHGVVAGPPDALAQVRAAVVAARPRCRWDVVAGGATRQLSVASALAGLCDDDDVVLVHDSARCLVPAEVVQRVVDAVVAGAEAVVPVVPVTDTVKQVADDLVVATIERSGLRQVQTPQGFRRDVLLRAYAGGIDLAATDDAGLAERAGAAVRVVDGHPEAFKITGPLDLVLAEAVLAARSG